MKRKKLSEKNQLAVAAYEAAAERIGRGKNFYACCAIVDAAGDSYLKAFKTWLRPKGFLGAPGWWPDTCFLVNPRDFETPERTMRILALLLMAELVRDGQIDFDAL